MQLISEYDNANKNWTQRKNEVKLLCKNVLQQ